uniref:Uncharacterized protein n=1 Tax=Meloidogyne incognita TaxID=6306 RepID=A0A914L7R9_MELIC
MKITDENVKSMVCAKNFTENQDVINHINFTPDGTLLVTSSNDDSITVYDCANGTKQRSVNSKKYGVDLIHFAHTHNDAIHASTKIPFAIFHFMTTNICVTFKDILKKVVTLCMSPVDDMFLSGSLDKTIRLWDLKSSNCQGLMQLSSRPIAAFDPEGLIFGAGIGNEVIKLYDLRSFDKGPFNTFNIGCKDTGYEWTGMKFSPDGKSILIMTNGPIMRMVDAYNGNLTHTLSRENEQKANFVATFSPDAKYVFCGTSKGEINCWSAESGRLVHTLQTDHPNTIEQVTFNPKYFMLASACKQLKFWIPSADE